MVDPTADYGLMTTIPSIVVDPASLKTEVSHVRKVGHGGGDVSFTSTTLAKLFGTELDITQTIEVGQLAVLLAFWAQVGPNSNNLSAGITIDGTINDGLALVGSSSSLDWSTMVGAVLVGDGSSHTFSLQGFVSGGTATLKNATSGGNYLPWLLLLILPGT